MDPGQQGEAIVWMDEARVRRAIIRGRVLEVASASGGVVVSWGGGLIAGYCYAPDGQHVAVTRPSSLAGAPPTATLLSPAEGEQQMFQAGIELPGLGVLHIGPLMLWAWRAYQERCAGLLLVSPPTPRPEPEAHQARPSLLTH